MKHALSVIFSDLNLNAALLVKIFEGTLFMPMQWIKFPQIIYQNGARFEKRTWKKLTSLGVSGIN